jgi:hypothetical protein
MKQGRDLQALAIEIQRQADAKRDYVASTKVMTMVGTSPGTAVVEVKGKGAFGVSRIAQEQIAEHCGIPMKYADRMLKEQPQLYAANVNTWFQDAPALRMARTLDGNLRAMLSDRFATFDNFDMASAALPILSQVKATPVSCELTEKRLYIKAVDESMFRDVPVGHKYGDGSHVIFTTVAPMVALANSEVGFGRWVIDRGRLEKACTNTALFPAGGMKRTHLGSKLAMADGIDVADLEAIMSSETKFKTMQAIVSQARDVIRAAFDPDQFAKGCERLAAAGSNLLAAGQVEDVVEIVQEKYGLTGDERNAVFQHFIEGGNFSQYGLHAAITRAAEDVADYDRATELEYLGGKVVELNRSEWQQLVPAK